VARVHRERPTPQARTATRSCVFRYSQPATQ
jgi:hypothetical protein